MNKIICIVQARQTSTRLPNKILKKINGISILEIINLRLKRSKLIDKIIFAIPNNKKNQFLKKYLQKKKLPFFEGNETNVLKRYYDCNKYYGGDIIVRITSDCPFVDHKLLDKMLTHFLKSKNLDFYSNTCPSTYPDGLDIEIFSKKSLSFAFKNCKSSFGQEHVTPFLKQSQKISKENKINELGDYSILRATLDTKKDLKKIRKIFNFFKNNIYASIMEVLDNKKFLKIFSEDLSEYRHAKQKVLSGQKIWRQAINLIPTGNHLLSKNPDIYIKEIWPSYFKKAVGCKIYDYDGNSYYDMTTMGIGTNILGYSNKQVNKSVIKSINDGNMSTLNCVEEVALAKRLLNLHPAFDMARFARTGGEANSIAIRIARAYTKKDNIAICGYHGWHDWYLSANLRKKNNLDSHLIKGLNISGVPKKLINTVFTFNYGDFNKLKKIVSKKDISIIKMEVCRTTPPDIKFLKKVRNLASSKKIVLIFDECTTGFRETLGGLSKKIKIYPDMLILGKALANGYPMTAVLGKKEIMQSMNKSFISSTFWSERSSYVAALKTLDIMYKNKTWKKLNMVGMYVLKNWKKIFQDLGKNFIISGIPSLASFSFNHRDNLKFKNYITQEMLKSNILATNTFYPSAVHKKRDMKNYFKVLKNCSIVIRRCFDGDCIDNYLKFGQSKNFFERLN